MMIVIKSVILTLTLTALMIAMMVHLLALLFGQLLLIAVVTLVTCIDGGLFSVFAYIGHLAL